MNKWLIALCLLPLCGCEPSSKEGNIPVVTSCDLHANPEKYNNQELEVTGRIIVEFEHQSLVCLNEEGQKDSLTFGIWLNVNLNSIEKRSPKFFQEIKEGCDLARAWKGGLRGNIRCRGRFQLSDLFIENAPGDKSRAGFGHFGLYGGLFTIEEVLDYQSVYTEDNPAN